MRQEAEGEEAPAQPGPPGQRRRRPGPTTNEPSSTQPRSRWPQENCGQPGTSSRSPAGDRTAGDRPASPASSDAARLGAPIIRALLCVGPNRPLRVAGRPMASCRSHGIRIDRRDRAGGRTGDRITMSTSGKSASPGSISRPTIPSAAWTISRRNRLRMRARGPGVSDRPPRMSPADANSQRSNLGDRHRADAIARRKGDARSIGRSASPRRDSVRPGPRTRVGFAAAERGCTGPSRPCV